MLILTFVCVAWLEIIGIQSAKKEACRREAVERIVGMMDAFMDYYKNHNAGDKKKDGRILADCYAVQVKTNVLDVSPSANATIIPIFSNDESPIGYRLRVVNSLPDNELFDGRNLITGNWTSKKWLIGELYNHNGLLTSSDKPFFVLPVCLWLSK